MTGTGFRSGLSITVGGTACATSAYVSTTSATCVTPSHIPGAMDIVLTNSDSQAVTLTGKFDFDYATVAMFVGQMEPRGYKDGVGTAARFSAPAGCAVDATATYMYVTDSSNQNDSKGHACGRDRYDHCRHGPNFIDSG